MSELQLKPPGGEEYGRLVRRIAPLLPEIERHLLNGATHAAIVAALGEKGIPVSRDSFRKILYRSRKKSGRDSGNETREFMAAKPPEIAQDPLSTSTLWPAQADGNPPPAPGRHAVEDLPSPAALAEVLDPARRDAEAEQYMRRRPLFGRPNQG